jgi:ABC-type uncharacterized transport system fused permease/ATPase subunit
LQFARLIYHQPHFAILDESTSALDSENEELMYKICSDCSISCISVGHRESLNEFHNDLLKFKENKEWEFYQKEEKAEKEEKDDKIININNEISEKITLKEEKNSIIYNSEKKKNYKILF